MYERRRNRSIRGLSEDFMTNSRFDFKSFVALLFGHRDQSISGPGTVERQIVLKYDVAALLTLVPVSPAIADMILN